MSRSILPLLAVMVSVTLIVGVILMGANLYGRYLRVSRGKAALLLIAAVLAAIGCGVWRANHLRESPPVLRLLDPVGARRADAQHFEDDDGSVRKCRALGRMTSTRRRRWVSRRCCHWRPSRFLQNYT